MAQPGVDIRNVRPDDHPSLRTIQQAVLDEPAPQLLAAAVGGLGIGLVAATDRPIGYIFAFVGDETAYVPEIAVDPSHHREGIGTALLDAVRRQVADAGASEIRLTVRVDDERARAFYRTNGFSEWKRRPEYYETEPAAGLVLSRSI